MDKKVDLSYFEYRPNVHEIIHTCSNYARLEYSKENIFFVDAYVNYGFAKNSRDYFCKTELFIQKRTSEGVITNEKVKLNFILRDVEELVFEEIDDASLDYYENSYVPDEVKNQ